MKRYVLKEHEPVEVTNLVEWAKFMQAGPHRVRANIVHEGTYSVEVETVFLGQDVHALDSDNAPLLFETTITGGLYSGRTRKASSWEEAVDGHERIVAALSKQPQSNSKAVDRLLD